MRMRTQTRIQCGRGDRGRTDEQLNARGEAGSERRNGYCEGAAPVKFRIQSVQVLELGLGESHQLELAAPHARPHGGMAWHGMCVREYMRVWSGRRPGRGEEGALPFPNCKCLLQLVILLYFVSVSLACDDTNYCHLLALCSLHWSCYFSA